MNSILTVCLFSLPLVLAFICLAYSFHFLRTARRLEDTPTSRIRSAAQGYLELSGIGKHLAIKPILGPLTQEPCVWYRYRIEEIMRRYVQNRTEVYWQTIDQGTSLQPFLLHDNTGECVILPKGAQVIPTSVQIWRGHSRQGAPPPKSFWSWLFFSGWGRYRYTEERIEMDKSLFTSGRFHTIRKDDPLALKYPILHDHLEHKKMTDIHVLSREGLAKDKTFIISSVSQEKLIFKFKARAFVFFIAFIGFAVTFVHVGYPAIKNGLQSLKVFQ